MDVKETLIVVLVLFVCSVVFEIILSSMKKKRQNELMGLFLAGELEQFDELLNRKSTKFFIPIYNSIVLNVNKAILIKDEKLLNEMLNKAEKIKMNDEQKTHLYSKAFSYYVSTDNNLGKEQTYKKVLECRDSQLKKYVMMVYDVFVKKGFAYLNEAEEMLKIAEGEDKNNLLTLIGTMYINKKDIEKSEYYFRKIGNSEEGKQ
ncbi:MAG: hypothetical protein VB012_03875 [Erysipelotrichaceae bacterium]|nr:hypothetical protein [Erysipelotrichaceae bacterium]